MNADDLTRLCREVLARPDWRPRLLDPNSPSKGLVTFCNDAVIYIARAYGYTGFDGLMANQIIDVMVKADANKGPWMEMPLPGAQKAGGNGHLVIVGRKEAPHGHVCVVHPEDALGKSAYSSKWGCQVPVVANVGAKNSWDLDVNWIFPGGEKPKAWLYVPREES